jgi:hypothetical protein
MDDDIGLMGCRIHDLLSWSRQAFVEAIAA